MTSDAKVGLLLGLVFMFVIAFIINRLPSFTPSSSKPKKSIEQLHATIPSIVKLRLHRVTDPNEGQAISWLTPEVENRIIEHVTEEIIIFPPKTIDETQKAVEVQLSKMEERIKNIESNFPNETDLEKAVMLNNTLLSLRIDQLSKQLEQTQSRILTRWDVALVFCAIVGGIIAVTAATCAVLSKIKKYNRRYRGPSKRIRSR